MNSLRGTISKMIPDSTRVNIRFKYRRFKYIFKYYKFSLHRDKNLRKTLIFIIDPSVGHPGLADRLKAIVGSYYIAKKNNAEFKILFKCPFDLEKYLIPNIVDWRIENKKIEKSVFSTKLIDYKAINNIKLKREIQYHIRNYIGQNLDVLDGDERTWSVLFMELFKPSNFLHNALVNQPLYAKKFSAIHIRFINNFEKTEPLFPGKPLSVDKQQRLIEICFNTIKKIERNINTPIVVFSDSMLFLMKAKENGFCVLDGAVGHISFLHSEDAIMKAFIDFYMLSKADVVYSLVNNVLYRSAFPRFGAMIHGKKIHQISIDNI